MLAEGPGEPAEGAAATGSRGLAFQPGDSSHAHPGLGGEFFLGQAVLTAQLAQSRAVENEGLRLGRAGDSRDGLRAGAAAAGGHPHSNQTVHPAWSSPVRPSAGQLGHDQQAAPIPLVVLCGPFPGAALVGDFHPDATSVHFGADAEMAAWFTGSAVGWRSSPAQRGTGRHRPWPGGHPVTRSGTGVPPGSAPQWRGKHGTSRSAGPCAKDIGLRGLPLHGFTQNQVWCELVAMACELTAWMAMLALDGPARAWEPKRLRLRLFTAAGRLARGGRRLRLRLAATWPWATQITTAITRLQALAPG